MLSQNVMKTKLDPRQVLAETVPDTDCSTDWYQHVNWLLSSQDPQAAS